VGPGDQVSVRSPAFKVKVALEIDRDARPAAFDHFDQKSLAAGHHRDEFAGVKLARGSLRHRNGPDGSGGGTIQRGCQNLVGPQSSSGSQGHGVSNDFTGTETSGTVALKILCVPRSANAANTSARATCATGLFRESQLFQQRGEARL
jgi:hypothetical protein